MAKLNDQRQRLFPACPEGQTRTLAVHFARSNDWPAVAALYQAVQEEFELPAPAISVSGSAGYGIWFSLAEAVPIAQATAFLQGLQRHLLAEIPTRHLALEPCAASPAIPALLEGSDKWSAFIDPTLGGMFVDEPWLDMEPNPEKQADILAGVRSIKPADFQRVLAQLQTPAQNGDGAANDLPQRPGEGFNDPRSFLLAVMNDASVSLALRIEAAKALLPKTRD